MKLQCTCRPTRNREIAGGRRAGTATVELALTLPFMLLMSAVTADFARVYHYQQILQVCARNGAVFVSDIMIRQSSPYESVEEAALAQAGSLRSRIRIEKGEVSDTTGTFATVTARCTFRTITGFPGLPREIELAESQHMRLPRSAEEYDDVAP